MSKKSTPTELKFRIAGLKPALKGIPGWRQLVFEKFKEFNNPRGGKNLDNIMQLATSHEGVTEFLEQLTGVNQENSETSHQTT